MNSSLLFVGVQFFIYLTAVVVGPITCLVGDDDDGGGDVVKNSAFDTIQQQLNKRWKMIMGPSWWSGVTDGQKEDEKTTASTVVVMPSTTKVPPRLSAKLSGGFFDSFNGRRRRGKKSSTTVHQYVTDRAKDAGRERDATVDSVVVATATAAVGPGRAAFGDENECMSANNGRPCVCNMTGFLYSIGERLDDEVAADNRTNAVATTFRCPFFKPVPEAFVVSPAVTVNVAAAALSDDNETATAVDDLKQNIANESEIAVDLREVDFGSVVNYRLETSKDDHYAVHYSFEGSDVRVRCLINADYKDTEIKAYKWDYRKSKKKTNSTITGTDAKNLLILGLDRRDSKNYTCSPDTGVVGILEIDRPYIHNVIAVVKPTYEIHGTMFYKTVNGSDCTPEIINYVRKQLPNSIRSEMCPEGPSRYACNVDVETSKCVEDEAGTLEINYLVVINDKASFLTRIRNSKKGRNVLYYQQLLARISNELFDNLHKIMTVKITTENHTHFEPDYSRIKINEYVSCAPGFGIREVFCAACPPHHYSPDKTAECLKCSKGFHQPFAGSKECVKCPSVFSSGCYMREVPHVVYYLAGFICLSVFSAIVVFCSCCCREENETNIRIIPRNIRKRFKRTKGYHMLENDKTFVEGLKAKSKNFKNLLRIKKKAKQDTVNSNITFKQLYDEFG